MVSSNVQLIGSGSASSFNASASLPAVERGGSVNTSASLNSQIPLLQVGAHLASALVNSGMNFADRYFRAAAPLAGIPAELKEIGNNLQYADKLTEIYPTLAQELVAKDATKRLYAEALETAKDPKKYAELQQNYKKDEHKKVIRNIIKDNKPEALQAKFKALDEGCKKIRDQMDQANDYADKYTALAETYKELVDRYNKNPTNPQISENSIVTLQENSHKLMQDIESIAPRAEGALDPKSLPKKSPTSSKGK